MKKKKGKGRKSKERKKEMFSPIGSQGEAKTALEGPKGP
jgi:hypothetical protein